MNPIDIVEKLSSFKERSCSGNNAAHVLQYLDSLFGSDFQKRRQIFNTPKNYLYIVSWLIGGIVLGICFQYYAPILSSVLIIFFVIQSLLYFNWYGTVVAHFPPISSSSNLIITKQLIPSAPRLILMAHWDTAPISFLYTPKMVGGFRSSLKINMLLMLSTVVASICNLVYENQVTHLILYLLAFYFLMQLLVASFDFIRFGYSNGASDNATGVAAAIATASNLWANNTQLNVELVLTGAEEVGMIGAKAYYQGQKNNLQNCFLINFDTLGAGDLKIITKTGTAGNIIYQNALVDIAQKVVLENQDLKHVQSGAWHTADFDSVWFNRAGVPTLTLAALDQSGRMPNIHRETDTLSNVNFKPMNDAILLASRIGMIMGK